MHLATTELSITVRIPNLLLKSTNEKYMHVIPIPNVEHTVIGNICDRVIARKTRYLLCGRWHHLIFFEEYTWGPILFCMVSGDILILNYAEINCFISIIFPYIIALVAESVKNRYQWFKTVTYSIYIYI